MDDVDRVAQVVANDARKAGWSGVVFALLLVAALVLVAEVPGLGARDADHTAFYQGGGGVLVYGAQAVSMYIITTTGVAKAAGLLPGPIVLVSYLVAIFLLVSTTFHSAIFLVLPAWVLLVGIVLLVHRTSGATS